VSAGNPAGRDGQSFLAKDVRGNSFGKRLARDAMHAFRWSCDEPATGWCESQPQMARKTINRMVRAVTDVLWERDLFQMRAIDKLLAWVRRRGGAGRRGSRVSRRNGGE